MVFLNSVNFGIWFVVGINLFGECVWVDEYVKFGIEVLVMEFMLCIMCA